MKLFLTLCAVVLLSGSVSAAPEPRELQTAPVGITPIMKDLLKLVNDARAANGATPLCLNRKLAKSAQGHVMDMQAGGFVSATGTDGSSPTTRAQAEAFNTSGVAELVGAVSSSGLGRQIEDSSS